MNIFTSMKFKFTAGVFLLIIMITVLLSAVGYEYEKKAIEKRVYAQLSATADLKKDLVANYINERINDLRALATAEDLRESVLSLLNKKALPSKAEYYTHSFQHLGSFKAIYPDYLGIEVIDMKGNIIANTEDSPVVLEHKHEHKHNHREGINKYVDIIQRGGAVVMQDYLDAKERHLDFAIGIKDKNENSKAIIISSIALKKTLFPIFSDYAGLGRTGETLLVKASAGSLVHINPTRHPHTRKGKIIGHSKEYYNLGLNAASGNEGIDEAVDYRGKRVVGAFRYMPILGWGIVVKMDVDEAFEGITALRKRILIFGALILGIMLVISYLIVSKFTAPIAELTEKTRHVASEDYSIRVGSHRRDEIGSLQNNFDAMVETLDTSRKEIEKKRLELENMNTALERKVAERTAELSDTNVALTEALGFLREQKNFSESLLQGSATAVFVINAQHKVLSWNKACEKLTGVPASDIIGTDNQWKAFYDHQRPCLADIVIDAAFERLPDLYATYATSAFAAGALHAEDWHRNLNGKDRYILFDAAPVYDSAGALVAAVTTLQDISERKKAETEIQERVKELEKFYEMAVGRELKMKELKNEVAKLKEELSRYKTTG